MREQLDYHIIGGDTFPFLEIRLKQGQLIKAESNAMIAMSHNLSLSAKLGGGIGRAIARRFAGESFFLQKIEAKDGEGWIKLGTFLPGTMRCIELKDESLLVQKGSFLAASQDLDIGVKLQNITRGFFSGEGFFISRITGTGKLFLSSYGGIQEITLKQDEEIFVDSGHLVAWDTHLDYSITTAAKGWISAVTTGELLALRFKGPGRIWIQSRNLKDFRNWLISLMPRLRSNS